MRNTLNYTTMLHGQEVTVTRHRAADGDTKTRKNKPVDDQLHALDMLLKVAVASEDEFAIKEIEKNITKRVNALTRG